MHTSESRSETRGKFWNEVLEKDRDQLDRSCEKFISLRVHSTCFGCQPQPSSGVHKTVTKASATGRIFCAATSLQRGQVNFGVSHTQHEEYTKL